MDRNQQIWMKMDGNGWKQFEMDGNELKYTEDPKLIFRQKHKQ